MSGPDHSAEGHSEGRTPAAPEIPSELEQLLGRIAPQSSLPGLLEEQPDTAGTLARAAEHLNAQRRARGRPLNSPNRRNDETFDYLEARGFKMPERLLAELISADPVQLAYSLACAATYGPALPSAEMILEIIKEQRKAAADLMPYKFAKKQELKVEHSGGQLHVMVAGALTKPGDSPATAFDLTGGAHAQTVDYQEVTQSAETPVGSQAVGPNAEAVEPPAQTGDQPAA